MPLPRILAKICATKEKEVAALLAEASLVEWRARAEAALKADRPRDFLAAVAGGSCNCAEAPVAARLIAEIKKASPSKGLIRPDFDPPAIAQAYERGGAAAISCLADREYFQGDIAFVTAARKAVSIPVMRKDFIIHPAQIYEARAAGADAVLLIARILELPALADFLVLSRELGMAALCEAHDEADIEKLLKAGAGLIGINNRDLDTFEVDVSATPRLRKLVPAQVPVVAESGIFAPADMRALAAAGCCAALVGESLMRQPDIETATKALLS